MAVDTIDVEQNLVANTNRGPSDVIWGNCPWLEMIENPARGMVFFDDFIGGTNIPSASGGAIAQGVSDKWAVYAYQGATITDAALEGGVLSMGSDGDNEGVAFGPTGGAFRLVTTSTNVLNARLWFEARIAKNTIAATKGDVFVGLIDNFLSSGLPAAAIPIATTDNTLSTTPNLIGFHIKGNAPTDINFVYQLAGGTAVYPTNLTTLLATTSQTLLAANAFVKVGFLFDPSAQFKTISSASTGQTAGQSKRAVLRIFVNGLELPAFLTTDNTGGAAFPTGFMGPSFAIMNQTGTTPPLMLIDWLRCSQLAGT